MALENPTLVTFYTHWQEYQDHIRDAIAPLSAAQLALSVAPGLRTVGQIALHIIDARIDWFASFLGEDAGEAASLATWGAPDAPARTAAELVDGLDRSWRFMAACLERWTPEERDAKSFGVEWRGDHYDLSRSWVVWHILEHDLHHGGELSLTLGLHGLPAPDI